MRYNQTMVITLLFAHVVLMSLSLLVTMSSIFVSILGTQIPKFIVRSNVVATFAGLVSGTILLIGAPLGAKCATLGIYLVAFVAAQFYIARQNQRLVESSAV